MCHAICESHHSVVFKTKVSRFRVKRHKWKGKVQKNVVFVDKESFLVSFMAEHKMSCFEIHSRQRSFGRLFKYIFYSTVKKITFLKENCHVRMTSRFS